MKRGIFITFEGPEGSGKSTHAKRLSSFLKSKGHSVILLREPGGTKISEEIRRILLDKRNKKIDSKTEALLYLAARAQLVKEKITPALKSGRIVILDRFQDSTIVYQGHGGGLDLSLLDKLGRFVTEGLIPDLTFLLDINTKEGLRRCGLKDRMEKKSFSFHQRVRKGYLELAKKNPKRFFLIEVDRDIDAVSKRIEKKVLEIISR
ncbi:MAG: dTMP kinase [Candidatus Omnitrophica bacterium]|nr:dTMP kinase [Candidatus Omnitrophota bacterium]